jgi:hypoxanthine-guanine phosphoribosyltransferase
MAEVDATKTTLVLSQASIKQAVEATVKRLLSDIPYDEHGDVVIVGIMQGAVHWFSDLTREWATMASKPPYAFMIQAQAYKRDGEMQPVGLYTHLSTQDIEAIRKCKHLILVDTVLETGRTLNAVHEYLCAIRVGMQRYWVCLIGKNKTLQEEFLPEGVHISCAWWWDEDPKAWFVGYGVDTEGAARAIPHLMMLGDLE